MFGRALVAKQLALMRLKHAFQNFATLRGLGIGDAHAGNFEALLGIPLGVAVADAQGGLRDKAQASPLEIGAQLENFGHGPQRGAIAFPRHDALVLVFDAALPRHGAGAAP